MTDKPLLLKYDEYEVKLYGECAELFRAARITSGNYLVKDLLVHVEQAAAPYSSDHPYQRDYRCLQIMVEGADTVEVRVPWMLEKDKRD